MFNDAFWEIFPNNPLILIYWEITEELQNANQTKVNGILEYTLKQIDFLSFLSRSVDSLEEEDNFEYKVKLIHSLMKKVKEWDHDQSLNSSPNNSLNKIENINDSIKGYIAGYESNESENSIFNDNDYKVNIRHFINNLKIFVNINSDNHKSNSIFQSNKKSSILFSEVLTEKNNFRSLNLCNLKKNNLISISKFIFANLIFQ